MRLAMHRIETVVGMAAAAALTWQILPQREAGAICREVTEVGSAAPAIAPDQEIVIIQRTGVPVGCTDDGDAGPPADAGAPPPDAADAGPPGDAGNCQPRLGDTITWIVQPRFSIGADGARFALLMVTPRPPATATAPVSLFQDLARATAPLEIVNEVYIEDEALGYQCNDPKFGGGGGSTSGGGCGGGTTTSGGDGDWSLPEGDGIDPADAGLPGGYVRVQAVGGYQVAVLAARDGAALAAWLTDNGYAHDAADIDALEPYLDLGWVVTAVRVKSDQPLEGGGLEPLSFTFEATADDAATDLRIPLGVSRQASGGHALLRVYVAAAGRTLVPGAGLTYAGWSTDMMGNPDPGNPLFLTSSLLDVDLARTAADDPVLVRDSADTPLQEEYVIDREIRIPSSSCPSGSYGGDPGLCDCDAGGNGRPGQLVSILVACGGFLWLSRRRRR
jgi:hypothetical protein